MNENERDYLIAKAFVSGMVEEALKLFAIAVMILIGLWVLGVILMYWYVIIPAFVIVVWWASSSSRATSDDSST
jgi:ABC-type transport system involved in cytochrome bd biosynthesis fused ATPase/permease subunit